MQESSSVQEVEKTMEKISPSTNLEPPKLVHKRGGRMTASPNRYLKRARDEHAKQKSALHCISERFTSY